MYINTTGIMHFYCIYSDDMITWWVCQLYKDVLRAKKHEKKHATTWQPRPVSTENTHSHSLSLVTKQAWDVTVY